MTLNKATIVEQVSAGLGVQRKESVEITETLLEIIKGTLASGDDVLVSGFGKFGVRDKKERKGRNPATGEEAIIPARQVVAFKWSAKLREKINGS